MAARFVLCSDLDVRRECPAFADGHIHTIEALAAINGIDERLVRALGLLEDRLDLLEFRLRERAVALYGNHAHRDFSLFFGFEAAFEQPFRLLDDLVFVQLVRERHMGAVELHAEDINSNRDDRCNG